MTIPIYLRAWREYAGMTQVEVGGRTGVTGTQVSRIENGKRDYDGAFLSAFRDAINERLATLPDRPYRIGHPCHAVSINPWTVAADLTAALQCLSPTTARSPSPTPPR